MENIYKLKLLVLIIFTCYSCNKSVQRDYPVFTKKAIFNFIEKEKGIIIDDYCGVINDIPVLIKDKDILLNIYVICDYGKDKLPYPKKYNQLILINDNIFFNNKSYTKDEFLNELDHGVIDFNNIILAIPNFDNEVSLNKFLYKFINITDVHNLNMLYLNEIYERNKELLKPKVI